MCVQVDGRVRVHACVCTFTGRTRARTKIRSTGVDLVSVRAKRYNAKSILKRYRKARSCKNKVDSSRPYFRTCVRAWRVTVQTHGRTLTFRSHIRSLVHTYVRTYVRSHACRSHTHVHTAVHVTCHYTYARQQKYFYGT